MKHYIQHIIEPKRLLLTWQSPDSGNRTRHVVAELLNDNNEESVTLRYLSDSEDFKKAFKLGFDGYPAFKKTNKEYSTGVMDAFMRRLPPRSRGDFSKYLDLLRIPASLEISNFALLGYSGAKLPVDGFSIIHPFDDVAKECELLMEVAGFRYMEGVSIDEISIGEEVSFEKEPDNSVDPDAIYVMLGNKKIGYVNRCLLSIFHTWLDQACVKAWVERKNGTANRPLVYLFVEVSKPVVNVATMVV